LHVGMAVKRHQRAPLIARTPLQFVPDFYHSIKGTIEFREFVAEKRIILCGRDCRKSTDQLIDGHRIESDFPEDHGLRTPRRIFRPHGDMRCHSSFGNIAAFIKPSDSRCSLSVLWLDAGITNILKTFAGGFRKEH